MAKTVSETRLVSDYDRIRLEGNIIATLIQDGTESVTIEVDADLLSRVKTEVGGGELVIGYKSWFDYLFGGKPVKAQIHLKSFRELQVSGSGRIEAASLQGERLRFVVSGSYKLLVNELAATSLETRVSGSGEFGLTGRVTAQDIHISGSGKYEAEKLESQDAEISISGSAKVVVKVERLLDVFISGSADVSYIGAPKVSQRISGSGRIHQLEAAK
jgi:hypothetical protein